jgi:hypothetical protein
LPLGGTEPYQYSLDGNIYQNNDTFSALTIGDYKVWIKDANACITTSTSKTITQPTDITFTINSVSAVKCYQGNDGVVTLKLQVASAVIAMLLMEVFFKRPILQ